MIVCLCGSFKFYNQIREIERVLCTFSVSCLAPSPFEFRNRTEPSNFIDIWVDLPIKEKLKLSRNAEIDFLRKIDKANSIYIVNPDGYIGPSVTLEIGYAFAKEKPIFAMESIKDITVMSLIDEILKPQEFAALMSEEDQ